MPFLSFAVRMLERGQWITKKPHLLNGPGDGRATILQRSMRRLQRPKV
jgi:hypothetical protein